MSAFEIRAVGTVVSSLTSLEAAPRQADEGAPEAWLVFESDMLEGMRNIRPGDELILITWLDRARRDVLSVHPRGDASRAAEGVFSTRSPHRPNPIGVHDVTVTAVEGTQGSSCHLIGVSRTLHVVEEWIGAQSGEYPEATIAPLETGESAHIPNRAIGIAGVAVGRIHGAESTHDRSRRSGCAELCSAADMEHVAEPVREGMAHDCHD